ncbi:MULTISPECIES: porin [unclassified Herbaspirillum]|uniref:porin n=1 Tax=unclassified Herbaspirillum TaxID=2624150 RepID=UPI00114FADC6|nr:MULTISPECIES: porin [unclassified Herbaspirillum]MBB5390451.1 putative porin [Herbaspirillum sp. SJZ102]TQK09054.1 putative porin [Herbaspirillum sp. SJZ130]TQK14259.1 putative porin [Herbaspirillum sp. SJZ106]
MKRSISAGLCAAMTLALPALAQESNPPAGSSSVTLYGVIDTGVEYVRGVPDSNGQSGGQFRVGYGGTPSRLGFKGTEDLGGGLAAIFTLETGLMADTGGWSQARMFGRQAFVGLSGPWGTLTFGRQYTMRYYGMLDADIFAAASQGLGALDSGIPNARADNSVSYRGAMGRLSGGVNYSFGRDTASANNPTATNCPGESTDKQQCREYSAMLKYDGGNWGVVSAFERQYGGTAATYAGLTSSAKSDTRLTVNGYLKFGGNQVGVGWLKRKNDGSAATPRSDLFWIAGLAPVTPVVVLDGMLATLRFDDSANRATLLTLRGTYLLSKRTSFYLSASAVKNGGTQAAAVSTNPPGTTPLPGGSQQSVMAGIRHTF